MTNLRENSNIANNYNPYYEFDLRFLLDSIFRRRKLSLIVVSSTVFLSLCYAFLSKPIYKGEFQIVLNQKNKNSITGAALFNSVDNPTIKSLLGSAFNTSSNINTEIEILKSKSVLMPIYNFVKKQKELEGNDMKNYKFSQWLSNVNIDLKPRTSVLNVSYKDSSMNLVLPVVRKISNAYKSYPGRDKNKGLIEALNYFDKQIEIITDKSEKAYRDYISYALENNLNTLPSGLPVRSYTESANNLNKAEEKINIDPRLMIQNQIQELEIEKIEVESIDIDEYDDRTMPEFVQISEERNRNLISVLDNKVVLLSEARNFFTEDDPQVSKLKNNIKYLNKKLHTKTLEYLDIEIRNLKSRLKLFNKPKEIVIKSKEMQRELIRLDSVLVNLENSKTIISLQLEEETNPWQLISTPFMDDSPIAPKKKQILVLGLFAGVFLGIVSAIYADKYSGLVYSLKEFKSYLNFNFLKEIDFNNTEKWEDSINMLSKNISESQIKKLGIACVNENNLYEVKKFTNKLSKSISNVNIVTSDKLMDLSSCEDIILLVSKGKVKKSELVEFKNKCQLLKKPLLGWIYDNTGIQNLS
tara:strand:- start:6533 stop:8284 length:1752 start_codon:yes stop_codon:yes gene_type:complete